MLDQLFNKYYASELSIAAIAIISLLIGVFYKRVSYIFISRIASISLIIPLYFLYTLFYDKVNINIYNNFEINGLIIFTKAICIIFSMLILYMFSNVSKKYDMSKIYQYELPILMCFSLLGVMIMLSSNNLLVLYMGIELQSLCLYILAASYRTDHILEGVENSYRTKSIISSEAGVKYFILSSISSAIMLYGISLIYSFSATINLVELSSLYNSIFNISEVPMALLIGVILLMIGLFFKIAIAPFHMWIPDVYEGSPTIITTFFAIIPKIGFIGVIIKLFLIHLSKFHFALNQIFVVVSVISLFLGAFAAIKQKSFKRLLAYSSISHMGFLLLGLVANNNTSIAAMLVYIVIYSVMIIGTFAVILQLEKGNYNFSNIGDLSGLAKTNPYLSATLGIIMFSMAGIPPFAGFFAKLLILKSLMNSGYIVLTILALISSVISAYYYLNIVKIMYFDEINNENEINYSFSSSFIAILSCVFNTLYIIIHQAFFRIFDIIKF